MSDPRSDQGVGTKGLLSAASIYVLANIANAAIPFLLMPILTRHLSPGEYGIVAMFQVLTGFIGPFVGLNVHGAIHRRYYDKEATDLPAYIGSCLAILMCSALVAGGALALLGSWVSNLASFPKSWLWAVVVVSVCQFLVHIRLVVWQAGVKPERYGLFQIAFTLTNLGLSVWLVVGQEWGWEGRVVGLTGAYLVFGVGSIIGLALTGWVRWDVRSVYVSNALRFGVPLIPHTFATYAITATDKIFITNYIGVQETGVYLIAVQLASVLSILAVSVNRAVTPWVYAQLKRESGGEKVVRLIYASAPVALAVALIGSMLSPPFLAVYVGEEFVRAGEFVPWLMVGQAFNAVYLVVVTVVFYAEKTHHLLWMTLAAAVLNVALNVPLTAAYGANGASMATAVTFFVRMALTCWLAVRVSSIPWVFPFRR